MPAHRMPAAILQEAVDALAKCKGRRDLAAKTVDVPVSTFNSRLREATIQGVKPSKGVEDSNDPKTLQSHIRRLETELKGYQKVEEQAIIIKGIIGSMTRQVEALDPPEWVINPTTKGSAPGVPTLFQSDIHAGEKVFPSQINNVNEYNVKIMHERFKTLVSSVVHLLKIISPTLNYPGIVIPLGGDMISGNIHDELTATNELNSMPAVLEMYEIEVGIIKLMADTFGRVFLPCVSGNHGRDTRKIWNKDRHHTSFDWLLYRFLAKHFDSDKRVTFFIPDGPDAYYKVYDHAYLLTHGDSFRGGDGVIGVMGPIIRGDHRKRSRNAQIDMEYDTMIMGHFHQYVHHGRFIINGSLKGYDEYAYTNNFGFEPPQQALWITHPTHGQTFRMPVFVGKTGSQKTTDWVSVPQ